MKKTRSKKTQKFTFQTVLAGIVIVAVALSAVMVALAQIGQGPLAPTVGEKASADYASNTCSVPFQAEPVPTNPPCKVCENQLDLYWGPTVKSFRTDASTNTSEIGPDGKPYIHPSVRYNVNVAPRFRRLLTFYNSKGSGGDGQPLLQTTLNECPMTPTVVQKFDVTLPAPGTDNCDKILDKLKGSIEGIRYEMAKAPNGQWVAKRIGEPILYNGYAKATVENVSSNCTYDVGFASYKANWLEQTQGNNPWGVENTLQELETQNLFDDQHLTIAPGETRTLFVKMPSENVTCHGARPTAK